VADLTLIADSVSRPVQRLLLGPLRRGTGLGLGYLEVGSEVIAIVPRGRPRMPNGIHVGLPLGRGERVLIGEGRLVTSEAVVVPGPTWEPRPRVWVGLGFERPFVPDCASLIGRGDGLTPAGDDLVAGYLAGRFLMHGERCEGLVPSEGRTTKLSRTLLEHAAHGEVPEPVHDLLERGDRRGLLAFGHSSGRWLMIGLCLGAAANEASRLGSADDLSLVSADRLLARCRIRTREDVEQFQSPNCAEARAMKSDTGILWAPTDRLIGHPGSEAIR
jgi:hypothetical protein